MKLFNICLITTSIIIFLTTLWFKKSESKFLTKEPEAFSFIVVGHIYPQYEALENVIRQAEEQGDDFIIITGDLINGGDKSLEETWQDFEQLMAQTHIPFYIAPGNHDVDNEEKRRVFEKRFGSTFNSFIFKNSKFILLNSCDYSKEYREDIDENQLAFLKTEYQDPWNYDHVFLFIHHPIWLKDFSLSNGRYDTQNSWEEKVYPLIKEKTKYVFAGDSTTFFYTKKDGISYFVDGFGKTQRENIPYFLQVKIKGKEIEVIVKTALSDAQHKIYHFEEKGMQ